MQQLITRQQELANLFRLTAAAREAFAIRQRLVAEMPAYQVKSVSGGFYHIIQTATGKVKAFRRTHSAALKRASELEQEERDDIGVEG